MRSKPLMAVLAASGAISVLGLLALAWVMGTGTSQAQDGALSLPPGACVPQAPIEGEANLFHNPGFELGEDPWCTPHPGEPTTKFQLSRDYAHSGEWSALLRMRVPAEEEGQAKVFYLVQEVTPEEFPELISGYYRVENWTKGTPKQYLQFVVIAFGATNLPGGYPNHQMRYPLAGISEEPFPIANAHFVFLGKEEPVTGEWVYFEGNIREDFQRLWGAVPEGFSKIRVLFEVRYDDKQAGPAPAEADVYWDDLYMGPAGVIEVEIDSKPGSYPNSINPGSKGKIPVAILSTPFFDATSEVDTASLTFGRTGDEESLAFCGRSPKDINGDGLLDLVCHFETRDTGFQCGDTEGILRGQTVDGLPIEGRDSVRIVPCPASAADDDPFWGPEDALVTMVEFSDFECPYCRMFATETLPLTREAYGDKVRFIYRDFPIFPHAQKAAEAAQCAHEQGLFWEYHDVLFANQNALSVPDLKQYAEQVGLDTDEFNDCLDSGKNAGEVRLDVRDGHRAGIRGVPAFLIDGTLVEGAQPFEVFQAIIEEALTGAGE